MSSSLPAVLPIKPFTHPVRGEVRLPGSKSLTNRALLIASLCKDKVTLTGALFSEDTHLMVEALNALGFTVRADAGAGTIEVSDQGNGFQNENPVDLFVGLAGTAARFLTALCAAAPHGVYRIDGIPQMRKRPMKGLIDALRSLGADVRCTGVAGFFPLEIHAKGLRGGGVAIDASESSQMLSALIMISPLTKDQMRISPVGGYRKPFVKMTTEFCAQFGSKGSAIRESDGQIFPPRGAYCSPGTFAIEPDATAASYYAALPLVAGGRLSLLDLKQGLQGDTQFVEVMKRAGLTAAESSRSLEVSFSKSASRLGISENFNEFSDTFLTLAAISPLLSGKTTITGVAHSRKQETDRIAGMVCELRKLGQEVEEYEDGLAITPRPLKSDVEIETYGDHRFAMSFGILGCHDLHGDGRPWLSIKDPACCAKTFPNFFDLLEDKRRESLSSS